MRPLAKRFVLPLIAGYQLDYLGTGVFLVVLLCSRACFAHVSLPRFVLWFVSALGATLVVAVLVGVLFIH